MGKDTSNADFHVAAHGSITILTPQTDAGQSWADDNLPEDAFRCGNRGYVVEPRYIAPIIEGIQQDGLTVEF